MAERIDENLLETIPLTQASEMISSPENIALRTKEALEACDFVDTPELSGGITEYYSEHYRIASALEIVLEEDPETLDDESRERQAQILDELGIEPLPTVDIEQQITNFLGEGRFVDDRRFTGPLLMAIRAARLDRPSDERLKVAELELSSALVCQLFTETGVGVTTIDERELDLVSGLQDRVRTKILESGLFTIEDNEIVSDNTGTLNNSRIIDLNGRLGRNLTEYIAGQTELFWDDCRNAGQPLFHSTSMENQEGIRLNGGFMTRRVQQQKMGSFNSINADEIEGKLWSPTVHFDENPIEDNVGVVFAVPIEDVIEVAPYARDAFYGVLEVKPERIDEVKAKIATYDKSLILKKQQLAFDFLHGWSQDRTFFASPHDVSPTDPVESAPDGYLIPINNPDVKVITTGRINEAQLGPIARGEYYPTPYPIALGREDSGVGYRVGDPQQEIDHQDLVDEFNTIIDTMVESRRGKIVVPIRRGVFDFSMADEINRSPLPRSRFNTLK